MATWLRDSFITAAFIKNMAIIHCQNSVPLPFIESLQMIITVILRPAIESALFLYMLTEKSPKTLEQCVPKTEIIGIKIRRNIRHRWSFC